MCYHLSGFREVTNSATKLCPRAYLPPSQIPYKKPSLPHLNFSSTDAKQKGIDGVAIYHKGTTGISLITGVSVLFRRQE
jgi:hypothetical protein